VFPGCGAAGLRIGRSGATPGVVFERRRHRACDMRERVQVMERSSSRVVRFFGSARRQRRTDRGLGAHDSKKDLEGEQSPRKDRAPPDRQRSSGVTDPTAEESLEVESPDGKASRPGTGNGTGRRCGDGTEATARGQRPQ